ncbi:Disease resistance RPP13-like protein 4 [Zea mays]|uniref:Disease resistance RPP13-like protein 4 n=1 Tax=Zea mays TaxID=4577 RepID=A0A1D6PN75_MAIZE|nr:Disease resistance RPP13-like protein 4 [Zea mays]
MLSKIKGQQGCRYWGGSGDEQDLIDSIRQHLQGKSYFIVIDDLWATSVWDFLSRAFPKDNCGSRIVITTQVTEVAFACCNNHTVDIFNMKPLDDDQSLQLFYSRVKHINGYNAEECKAISHGIVSNCGNLSPLAIINIAGMLAGWADFNMNDWEYVSKCCTSTANLTTEEATERFLNLMYNKLPAKLKTCLLYLSMYPEGCVIGKDDLVRQWAAEGIFSQVVEPKGREHEVGFIYFDELLKRGLIQPVDTDYNDQVLSCIVHQVVLEFITKKSMQENFITVVDYRETGTVLDDNKVHRLSARFEGAKSAQIPRSFRVRQVRSFMFSGFIKSLPSLLKYCLVRVLILHVWSDDQGKTVVLDLSPVGNMLHVRYLKVVSNMIVKLPLIIRGLRHLETLEVDAEEVAVPLDVFILKSLLHLRLPSKAYQPDSDIQRIDLTNTFPLRFLPFVRALSMLGRFLLSHGHRIRHLTSLQSLGYFDLSTCSRYTVWQLGKLTNLRDLHLTCSAVRSRHRISNIQCLASVLGKCTSLESLTIRGEASSNQSISFDGLSSLSSPPYNLVSFVLSPRIFKMAKLPKWIGQLSRLSTLKIAVGELSSEDVDILKGLSALTALSLYVRRNPKKGSWILFSKGFAVLKYFKFTCTALCVKFSEQAMPAVQRLIVCFNANTMQQYRPEDAGIWYLSGLQVISARIGAAGIDQASREAAKSRLLDAILSNHPKPPPIRNVQMVDWVIHGDTEECSTGVMIRKDESSREHTRSFLSQFPFRRRPLLPSIFTRRGQDDEQHKIEENDVLQDSIILRKSSSLMQKPGTLHSYICLLIIILHHIYSVLV